MLKCVENCGPRHRLWRLPWARCQKMFKFTLYIYIFLRNQSKKFTIEPKSNTAMLLYLFFNSLLSICLKKWKLKNGPRLPTFPYSMKLHLKKKIENFHTNSSNFGQYFSLIWFIIERIIQILWKFELNWIFIIILSLLATDKNFLEVFKRRLPGSNEKKNPRFNVQQFYKSQDQTNKR